MSFEEALRRWSPPADHTQMEALHNPSFDLPLIVFGGPPDPREEAYFKLRRRLCRSLLDRLADANLLSSATEEKPDPRNPRFLVHPSVYDDQSLSYSRFRNVLMGRSIKLWNIEIFEPNSLPRNISVLPEWLGEFASHLGERKAERLPEAEARSLEGFWHDANYAHVSINGSEFALNPVQAGIVRVLHQAALKDVPWVTREALRQEVRFNHEKLSGVFRHVKDPSWRELIASDGRGAYRLNIRSPNAP